MNALTPRYLEELCRGWHDDDCERRERFAICHCHKRQREARGLTEPPTEDLDFPPPSCPSCGHELWFDDGWRCDRCALAWQPNGAGASAEFIDDFGDRVSRMDPDRWGRRLIDMAREPS